jgi:hypothetical protein
LHRAGRLGLGMANEDQVQACGATFLGGSGKAVQ